LPPVSYKLVLSDRQKDAETDRPVKYHCSFPSSTKRPSLTQEIWCCLPHQWAVGDPKFLCIHSAAGCLQRLFHPISFFRLIVQSLPIGRRVYATCSAESFVFLDGPSFSVSSSFRRIRVTFISYLLLSVSALSH